MDLSLLAYRSFRYDYFKTRILDFGLNSGYPIKDGLILHSVSSTLAGIIATSKCATTSSDDSTNI